MNISVVMAVHNGASTLAETMDSILAQTESDFEVIVVDDGSTDETPRILQRYERVRVIRNAGNIGLTRSLIAGCAAARGTYIARHDAGDRSHPDRLRKQRQLLDEDAQAAYASCITEYVGPRGEFLFVSRAYEGPSHHGSVLFRRDAYERAGGYRAEWYYGQDWDLWYRLGKKGSFRSIDETLYTARVTPESISGTAREEQLELGRLSRAAFLARERGESDAEFVAAAARIGKAPPPARDRGLYFIGEALRRNGDARAREYLRDAIRANPLYLRAWIRYAQSWMR